MTNVIPLGARRQAAMTCAPVTQPAPGPAALIEAVVRHRQPPDSVPWMKECAELLNILEVTRPVGRPLPQEALAPFLPVQARLEEMLRFFPQYYRFLLSIALDLEALGLTGEGKGIAAAMVSRAARQGLARGELSDLQRAEARRLMARRGVDPLPDDRGLEPRLRAFAAGAERFALPNRKAAYELTHVVFYLSEYGRRDPGLSEEVARSLTHAGLVAFLDRDSDLLAEVCIALRQAGHHPPPVWEAEVARTLAATRILPGAPGGMDGYHEAMVSAWLGAVSQGEPVAFDCPPGPCRFVPAPRDSALLPLSLALHDMPLRSAEWERMRERVLYRLAPEARSTVKAAEASTPAFPAFFAHFARAEPRRRRAC